MRIRRRLIAATVIVLALSKDAEAQSAAIVCPFNAPRGHFIYTLTINDKNSFNIGPMKSSLAINMTATSDFITGPYRGHSTSVTTNQMNSGGAALSAPSTSTIPDVTVNFKKLPLSKGVFLNMRATGSMPVTSRGVGTVTAGGHTSRAQLSNSATVPYALQLINEVATLTISIPEMPPLAFRGKLSAVVTHKGFKDKEHDMMRAEAPDLPFGKKDDGRETVHTSKSQQAADPCLE